VNNPVPIIDDKEYMRSFHQGRLVSDVIDDYNEKNENYFNRKCEVTLLPRLVINDQLLVPIETCSRLVAFKLALEQDEKREEAKRNYVPSSVLTEAELFLRTETVWWLKNNGSVSVDAGRVKVKESDDEPGGVEEADFNKEAIPEGAYSYDSPGDDGEAPETLDAPEKNTIRTREGGKVRKSEWNESIKGLCWYYE